MFKPVDPNINFPEMEKKWLAHWYKTGVVKKYLTKNNKSNKYFSFLDGPITANNPMGVHHAWGRTYKDLWPKFHNLLGYKQRFQNGFDCQGLWVEVEVEKELGLRSKKDIENLVPGDRKKSIAKFVQLCKDRVMKFSAIQTEQSKRLGYFADWDHSYFTMSPENNYMIWHFLKTCFNHGWIYKGHESVPWCPRCETAISQHEMLTEDYKELVHESVILEFKIKNSSFAKASPYVKTSEDKSEDKQNSKISSEYLLVWTTTPWTIPANIAVAVDAKADYCLVQGKISKEFYFWVMKDLVKSVFTEGYEEIVKTVKGKELVGLKYTSPFDNLPIVKEVAEENPDTFHTVIPTDNQIMPISAAEGTGLVHTAVSAGTEDFLLGKKLGLPMIPVIADNADYLPGLGFLTGKNAKKHPEIILDFLREEDKKGNDCVFSIFKYKHRYPACWRCKTELVWKVEDEWYIAMDLPSRSQKSTLRERMMEVAKKIKWMPEFGLERELDWLKNMHDWLISKKNRYWGLALPIYECEKCGNFEIIGSKEELKIRAVSGWSEFEGKTPHKPYIDEVKTKCQKCESVVSRVDDVGNPWLDAGIVAYSTIAENNQGEPLYLKNKKEWEKWFPVDFITESFPGQFKNWFYALIAESTVLENKPPFKRVLGFGTQLGEDGRPMHKSWGNAIEFNEGADKIGVDVMRWMFTRHNPADNMLFGYKKADEVRRQFYLKLWNIYKFFVEYSNLDEWSGHPQGDQKHSGHPKGVLDKWIISRLAQTTQKVEERMREFDAKDATLAIEKFVSDLSTWFLRRSRDRVWVNSDDEKDKKEFYETLYFVLVNLSIITSPFMPFISEEIYKNLTDGESVHLETWPKFNKKMVDDKLILNMELARNISEAGHAKRKADGQKVRIPLAVLSVKLEGKFDSVVDKVWELILKELNVKNIEVNGKNKFPKKFIEVSPDDLENEGQLRELLRTIQSKRKEMGLKPTDHINLTIPDNFLENVEFIKKRVMAHKVSIGPDIMISK